MMNIPRIRAMARITLTDDFRECQDCYELNFSVFKVDFGRGSIAYLCQEHLEAAEVRVKLVQTTNHG